MSPYETFSVPRSLQPSIVMTWLARLASIDVSGAAQLGDSGVILLISESYAALFRAIYASQLSQRRGLFLPSWQSDETHRDYAAYLKNKYDALIAIDADEHEARANVRDALRLARAADALIFPIGLSILRQLILPGESHSILPLPGARISVVMEAPFKTAQDPNPIPTSWHRAVIALVERANTQAANNLTSTG